LIIGTIHPHKTDDFIIDFFYGNKNSLWSILSNAFPNKNFSSLKHITETLEKSSTAISDMIRKCDRDNDKITQDKDLYNLCLNTKEIREGIKNSSIKTIFLTSRFGKNNAAKLFVDNFNIKYKNSWDEQSSSFVIPKDIFGREIKAIVLFSPSGQANTGISKSLAYKEKRHMYLNKRTPVNE